MAQSIREITAAFRTLLAQAEELRTQIVELRMRAQELSSQINHIADKEHIHEHAETLDHKRHN